MCGAMQRPFKLRRVSTVILRVSFLRWEPKRETTIWWAPSFRQPRLTLAKRFGNGKFKVVRFHVSEECFSSLLCLCSICSRARSQSQMMPGPPCSAPLRMSLRIGFCALRKGRANVLYCPLVFLLPMCGDRGMFSGDAERRNL